MSSQLVDHQRRVAAARATVDDAAKPGRRRWRRADPADVRPVLMLVRFRCAGDRTR